MADSPDPASAIPAVPQETLLDASKPDVAHAKRKPKPDVTCCRCGVVLLFVQAWRGGTPERYWCGVCVRYAGAAQEYVPEDERVRCVDSPNDQHGYECALCGHRLSGLDAAAFEAARVRAFRQARIWEPNMDLYNVAMSVYCAAFGKDEEHDRSVAAGAGDPDVQAAATQPSERPNVERLTLNAYGRECYRAGQESMQGAGDPGSIRAVIAEAEHWLQSTPEEPYDAAREDELDKRHHDAAYDIIKSLIALLRAAVVPGGGPEQDCGCVIADGVLMHRASDCAREHDPQASSSPRIDPGATNVEGNAARYLRDLAARLMDYPMDHWKEAHEALIAYAEETEAGLQAEGAAPAQPIANPQEFDAPSMWAPPRVEAPAATETIRATPKWWVRRDKLPNASEEARQAARGRALFLVSHASGEHLLDAIANSILEAQSAPLSAGSIRAVIAELRGWPVTPCRSETGVDVPVVLMNPAKLEAWADQLNALLAAAIPGEARPTPAEPLERTEQ